MAWVSRDGEGGRVRVYVCPPCLVEHACVCSVQGASHPAPYSHASSMRQGGSQYAHLPRMSTHGTHAHAGTVRAKPTGIVAWLTACMNWALEMGSSLWVEPRACRLVCAGLACRAGLQAHTGREGASACVHVHRVPPAMPAALH